LVLTTYIGIVTVLEVIQKSTEFLAKKAVDSPRLQTELLLASVLKLPRMQLYLNFERVLTASELDACRELVKRRSQREPLQHILGSTSFCGFEIAVNRHVLVPRPETELLAERGWRFLSEVAAPLPARASRGEGEGADSSIRALDFGTGSGCLAIALAIKCPAAQIYALDICPRALGLARQNAEVHKVADRIQFLEGDGFAAIPPGRRFDLIIGNPPYIPSEEIIGLEPEVRDFDPPRALDGGPDGLDFYRRLAADGAPFLKSEGRMMLEFGDAQGQRIRDLFEEQKWIVEAIVEDYTRRPRILIARRE
jgi:release factor glutamine methyltransferase